MKREKQPTRSGTKHWQIACVGVILIVCCLFFRQPLCMVVVAVQDYRACFLRRARECFLSDVHRENIVLHKHIAVLESEIGSLNYLRIENQRLLEQCRVHALAQKSYIGARIIENNIHDFHQHAVVDVGRIHGVARGDVVVCGYKSIGYKSDLQEMQSVALVGIVEEVFQTCSKVLLAIDRNFLVPVQFSADDRNAMLKGNNGAYAIMTKHEDYVLEEGEIAFTSGCGGVFPPGVIVGKVILRNGLLEVVSPIKFASLSFVCVLRNSARDAYVE